MRSPKLFVLYGRVRRAINGVFLVFDDFFEKCCWNGLLASYVVVAVVLLTKTVSCDGVGVQWQQKEKGGGGVVRNPTSLFAVL